MRASLTEDPINQHLLSLAEDRLTGFHEHPLRSLAVHCGISERETAQRLIALQRAGIVRCVRQTLPSTLLTKSCLVAWHLPDAQLETAFDWIVQNDPFSGHVVIREAEDPAAPGSSFRLWTTLRLPAPEGDTEEHCRTLAHSIGALEFVCMPVVGMFRLSVGHLRRAGLPPGTMEDEMPSMQKPPRIRLDEQEQRVLLSFRAPLSEEELLSEEPWSSRAAASGMQGDSFCRCAHRLADIGALGRFAVVLDHTNPAAKAAADTGQAALLLWSVPPGSEERAGSLCARHVCMTHCYWRSGAEKVFGGAQIMGMVHGATRDAVRAHRRAIDAELTRCGISLLMRTQMHWTLRARIRASEFDPALYASWRSQHTPAPKKPTVEQDM